MPLRALVLACLVACKAGGDGIPSDAPDPAVEVGTGEASFEALEEGDPLLIVEGPQGGYHFNGSLRAVGINPGNPDDLNDPENPTIRFRAFADGEQRDIGIEYTQGLRDGGAPFTNELLGRRVLLDIPIDAVLDGVEVDFEVEIEDADGNTLLDRRRVVAEPHPLNGTAF